MIGSMLELQLARNELLPLSACFDLLQATSIVWLHEERVVGSNARTQMHKSLVISLLIMVQMARLGGRGVRVHLLPGPRLA
jgi:hypothetical protein